MSSPFSPRGGATWTLTSYSAGGLVTRPVEGRRGGTCSPLGTGVGAAMRGPLPTRPHISWQSPRTKCSLSSL